MATSVTNLSSVSKMIQTHVEALTKANEIINGVLKDQEHPHSKEKMLNCLKGGISETLSYVEEWKKDDQTLLANIQQIFQLAVKLETAYLCFAENKIENGQALVRETIQLESILPKDERVSAIVFKRMWELKDKPKGDTAGQDAFYASDADSQKCKQSMEEALVKFSWTFRTAQNFLLNCKDVINPPKSEIQQQHKEGPIDGGKVVESSKIFWSSFFKWVGLAWLGAAALGLVYYIFKGSSEQV